MTKNRVSVQVHRRADHAPIICAYLDGELIAQGYSFQWSIVMAFAHEVARGHYELDESPFGGYYELLFEDLDEWHREEFTEGGPGMWTVWAHPMNIEMRMAEDGERVGRYETRVGDGGALIMTVDDIQIAFESPMDMLSVLHEAREMLGDYILEHPEHFDVEED